MADPAKADPVVSIEPQAPAVPVQQSSAASWTQLTQVPAYVPPHVWTTQALMDLHQKQKEMGVINIKSLDDQRVREHRLNWGGFFFIGVIIVSGLVLIFQNNPVGKDIIGATVLFLAGFLAGQGQKKTQT